MTSAVQPSMPLLPQRAIEGAEFIVAHGAPHLKNTDARQEKEAVIDQLHGGIRKLIGHGGHGRQLEPSLTDGLDGSSNVGGSLTPISFIRPCISSSALLPDSSPRGTRR